MPTAATSTADSLQQLDPTAELNRQVDAYVAMGYPELAGVDEAAFRALFEPLAQPLADAVAAGLDLAVSDSRVPFVAVVTDAVMSPEPRVPLLRAGRGKKEGILDRNYGENGLAPYRAMDGLDVPDAPVYLLLDVERGDEFKNVKPMNATPVIAERGRTVLTIAEGLSFNAAFPDKLIKNHCFMLAGSHEGNRRVPAIWISAGAPKLGWCFQGVEHTWLGIASAAGRAI
ncbi:DUF5701 family protein [Demequina aurantiaca]|uniref:DUF5701 family protein n=1 Tax=Demequina aurantiaca TaxID=676200 RepID=UPI000785FBCF|nr:DUF5701 family protein [Demequina aurantiaca]